MNRLNFRRVEGNEPIDFGPGYLSSGLLRYTYTVCARQARFHGLDADELFQGCCLLLLEKAADYDPARGSRVGYAKYLVGWAARTIPWQEHRKLRRLLFTDDLSGVPAPDAEDRDPGLDETKLAAVRVAINELPPKLREPIVRRFGLNGEPPDPDWHQLPDHYLATPHARYQRGVAHLRKLLANPHPTREGASHV